MLTFVGKPALAYSYLDSHKKLSVTTDEAKYTLTVKNNYKDSIIYWESKDLFDGKMIKFMPGEVKTFKDLLPELREENYNICRKKQFELDTNNTAALTEYFGYKNYDNYPRTCPLDKEILESENINLNICATNLENKSYLKDYIQVNQIKNNSDKKLYIITLNSTFDQLMQKRSNEDTTMFKSREKMMVLSFTGLGALIYLPVWAVDELVSKPINIARDATAVKNIYILPEAIEVTELLPQQEISIKSIGSYLEIYDTENKVFYSIKAKKN